MVVSYYGAMSDLRTQEEAADSAPVCAVLPSTWLSSFSAFKRGVAVHTSA